MANVGAWPINPATPVGFFRFQVGDVVGTPHDPEDSTADFEFMGDDAIEALLAAHPNSINAAKADALQSMAIQLIAAAQEIQVDDIRIKTIERARLMMELSMGFGGSSAAADAASAFSVVPLNSQPSFTHPQGQPYPIGF